MIERLQADPHAAADGGGVTVRAVGSTDGPVPGIGK